MALEATVQARDATLASYQSVLRAALGQSQQLKAAEAARAAAEADAADARAQLAEEHARAAEAAAGEEALMQEVRVLRLKLEPVLRFDATALSSSLHRGVGAVGASENGSAVAGAAAEGVARRLDDVMQRLRAARHERRRRRRLLAGDAAADAAGGDGEDGEDNTAEGYDDGAELVPVSAVRKEREAFQRELDFLRRENETLKTVARGGLGAFLSARASRDGASTAASEDPAELLSALARADVELEARTETIAQLQTLLAERDEAGVGSLSVFATLRARVDVATGVVRAAGARARAGGGARGRSGADPGRPRAVRSRGARAG